MPCPHDTPPLFSWLIVALIAALVVLSVIELVVT